MRDHLTLFPEFSDAEINITITDLRAAYEGAIPAAMAAAVHELEN